MELTRGRDQFPTVMERVEVMSDMKQEREMDAKGLRLLEIFLPTHLKYQGNVFLDIKIRLF